MEPEIENATDVLVTLGAVAAGLVVAFLLGSILSAVVRRMGHRSALLRDLSRRCASRTARSSWSSPCGSR
ncbi:hypothetical protein [Cellulosimicrobium sp. CUA-896]|uniref:hypothetical protein n=1 Tax=Cellulosimicrobium sp. CUA-896 TaxID=1517881 RepID=UPI00095F020D|nr:hypothetical protein [Cellulosimicrobium sp. CUA-896]OLT50977.1 hypothetical protein BJF88_02475 [Cellulosimicrobium sp. CUA-896]